jgi:hypothetical protein
MAQAPATGAGREARGSADGDSAAGDAIGLDTLLTDAALGTGRR